MSMSNANQSMGVALVLLAAARGLQLKMRALVHPATLRRAQAGLMRVITVVAGH